MRSGYRVADNFEILMEIAAISLSNLVRTDKFDEREKRYYKLLEAVDYEAATAAFSEIMAWFHEQAEPRDLLGPLHSYLGLDNSGSGQFFTPRHICDFMNQCLMPSKKDVEATIADKGYISIQDPTVGAGGMLVAAAKVLKVKGVEVPQLDAKTDAKKVAKLGIRFVDYSEKAFLVFSDTTVGIGKNEAGENVEVGATMLLHKELAQLGGGYKNWAKAWLFSKANAEKQVKELFGKGITPMTKAEYEKAKTA